LILISAFSLAGIAGAQTLHVDPAAPFPGAGASWDDAYTDLQDALDAVRANPGAFSEIRLAAGVYTPDRATRDRDAVFELVPHVAIVGGFAGSSGADPNLRAPHRYRTVLSGDLLANDTADPASRTDNARRVCAFTGEWGVDQPITLDGVTISAGAGDDGDEGSAARFELAHLTLVDCVISENRSVDGSALRLQYCGPLSLERVTVIGNTGGGMDADGCWDAAIRASDFVRNTRHEPDRSTRGGGLSLRNTRVTLTDCEITQNSADRGGGASLLSGDVTLVSTRVAHNTATTRGGGLEIFSGETALLRSQIIGNAAGDGAGVSVSSGSLDAVSTLFWANAADDEGGALHLRASFDESSLVSCVLIENTAGAGGAAFSEAPLLLAHCTVWGNHAQTVGGVLDETIALTPLALGSIFWNNSDDSGVSADAQLTSTRLVPAQRSFIQAWSAGGTNSADDPLVQIITQSATPVPVLLESSPALDHGDTADLPRDLFDLDNDGEEYEPSPIDYLGAERTSGPSPDAGAVERAIAPAADADLTGDGVVGPADLTVLLSMWGPCPSSDECPGDLNLDAEVGGGDLTILLGAWSAIAPPATGGW